MADIEKAIRILEGNYKSFVLRHNGELLTVNELIALLKAQEARVIKVAKYDDEIQSPEMDCFTWIEEREREDVYIGTVNRTLHKNYGEETYSFIRFWGKSKDGIKFEDYGKTWL